MSQEWDLDVVQHALPQEVQACVPQRPKFHGQPLKASFDLSQVILQLPCLQCEPRRSLFLLALFLLQRFKFGLQCCYFLLGSFDVLLCALSLLNLFDFCLCFGNVLNWILQATLCESLLQHRDFGLESTLLLLERSLPSLPFLTFAPIFPLNGGDVFHVLPPAELREDFSSCLVHVSLQLALFIEQDGLLLREALYPRIGNFCVLAHLLEVCLPGLQLLLLLGKGLPAGADVLLDATDVLRQSRSVRSDSRIQRVDLAELTIYRLQCGLLRIELGELETSLRDTCADCDVSIPGDGLALQGHNAAL
mmetsp:Transcript_143529/g.458999  ORF Transcript_143529/g.458999 Transcript_143529/m.458999 type:complete len:306 (+) Transcript_143529:709-1626(+)